MKVEFTKIEANDPTVVALAEQTGQKATAVAAMINQVRYRKAYNKVKMEETKKIRQLIKAHPELVAMAKEVK